MGTIHLREREQIDGAIFFTNRTALTIIEHRRAMNNLIAPGIEAFSSIDDLVELLCYVRLR